jgi:hypothetical protein
VGDKDSTRFERFSDECAKARASRQVDRQSEDSFPASDPQSYSGSPIIGAPEREHGNDRETLDREAEKLKRK